MYEAGENFKNGSYVDGYMEEKRERERGVERVINIFV